MQNKNIIQNNVVSLATRLWLVKCYDRKKVKSLVDLTIIHVVWSRGEQTNNKKKSLLVSDVFKVDSWWRWLFWHCSYCLCKCDAPGPNSDRHWSLLPAVTNVTANMVVTGVRLVKKKGVIHLEIEQAPAAPEGLLLIRDI